MYAVHWAGSNGILQIMDKQLDQPTLLQVQAQPQKQCRREICLCQLILESDPLKPQHRNTS